VALVCHEHAELVAAAKEVERVLSKVRRMSAALRGGLTKLRGALRSAVATERREDASRQSIEGFNGPGVPRVRTDDTTAARGATRTHLAVDSARTMPGGVSGCRRR
jgi:hypothetical protein